MQYLTCNIQATIDLGIQFTCIRTSCLTIEQQQLYNNTMQLRGYEVLLLKDQLFFSLKTNCSSERAINWIKVQFSTKFVLQILKWTLRPQEKALYHYANQPYFR